MNARSTKDQVIVSVLMGVSTCSLASYGFAQQAPPPVAPGAAQPLAPFAAPPRPDTKPNELSVPPVIDRPLGMDEGIRIPVTRFELKGASAHPHQKLYPRDLQKILDQGASEQPAGGYTVNQLQRLADRLRDMYRAKGFMIATVFVPAQTITGGVVTVQVLEGRLEGVRVEGNKHYRASTLLGPFNSAIGGTVNQPDLEARLLRLDDYPGLSVFGVMTPGRQVGTSDLVLKVQQEHPFNVFAGVDNYGNPYNGQYRGNVGAAWNDPLGIGDRFRVNLIKDWAPHDSSADTKFGSADYRVPFLSGLAALDASYSVTDYTVGGQLAGNFSGTAKIGEVAGEMEFMRSRYGRAYAFLKIDSKKAYLDSAGSLTRESLVTEELGAAIDYSDHSGKGRWIGSLSVEHGHNSLPTDESIRLSAASGYVIEHLSVTRIQSLTEYQSLQLRGAVQWTSDSLPSVEETSLGGPTTVRAYEVAHYTGDKSAVANLEYYAGIPFLAPKPAFLGQTWGRILQFVAFVDYGNSKLNSPLAGEQAAETLRGYGVGLQFNLASHFYLRGDVSKPFGEYAGDAVALYHRNPRYYFTANFNY